MISYLAITHIMTGWRAVVVILVDNGELDSGEPELARVHT
jgi:hypothetical protein